MEAVVLAGGKGTRLKPYTTVLPKPLMPVGEQSIMSILLRQLYSAGCRKVTLAVNHMADLIMSFYGSGERFGIELSYSVEDTELGTVGPLKLIDDLPENFLVMNGDILTDLPFRQFFDEHVRSGATLTIAAYRRIVNIDFGVLQADSVTRALVAFQEKPSYEFAVSMGIYAFHRSALDNVPDKRAYGFDSLVIDMLARRDPIKVYPYEGYWLDLGRPDDYDQANRDIALIPGLLNAQQTGTPR